MGFSSRARISATVSFLQHDVRAARTAAGFVDSVGFSDASSWQEIKDLVIDRTLEVRIALQFNSRTAIGLSNLGSLTFQVHHHIDGARIGSHTLADILVVTTTHLNTINRGSDLRGNGNITSSSIANRSLDSVSADFRVADTGVFRAALSSSGVFLSLVS